MKIKVISLLNLIVLLFSITSYAYAEDQTVTQNSSASVSVYATKESVYTVVIPKTIIIDAKSGEAEYKITASGDLAGNEVLKVVPSSSFTIQSNEGKKSLNAVINQSKVYWDWEDLSAGIIEPGYISVSGMSAGTWYGAFSFNMSVEKVVRFKIGSSEYIAEEDMTWESWINSEYNTGGWYIHYNRITTMHGNREWLIAGYDNGIIDVKPSDLIISSHIYSYYFDK